jgi:farnesyl-diphosphate farnesyltransferase
MTANSMKFSKEILKEVSRSFALTIPMLDKEIKDEVLLTYLQDRILDNFEDEINPADFEFQKKMMDKVSRIFSPEEYDRSTDFRIIKGKSSLIENESLQKLNKNIEKIYDVYKNFDPKVKQISHKWLVEMNDGMQKYLDKKVETFAELDEYCYYVAGTVGGFLTELIIYKKDLKGERKKF